MADNQTLADLQEVLLKARIKFTTGTAVQWTTANPVLLDGEVGFVKSTYPAQFKVGDGTKKWSELSWGQPTTLAQLTADATHRLVTDTQIAGWNNKAEKTAATTSAAGLMSAVDKAKLDNVAAGANNYVHPASHPASMITPDAMHRFVTDTEKGVWNAKSDVFVFDYEAYNTSATAASQKQIVKDIVAAVAQKRTNIVVVVRSIPFPGVEVYLPDDGLNGFVSITGSGASYVDGLINDFRMIPNEDDTAVTLQTVQITFASDGTVDITPVPYTSELVTKERLPEYTVEKGTTVSGFAATYYLKKGVERVGIPINIPLDQVLKSSSIKSVTTANTPYSGAKVGDKYIEFLFQNNNTPQYLPVQDLVDVYKGDSTYIQVSSTNVISLNYNNLKSELEADLASIFDGRGEGAAAAKRAINEFKNSEFILQCSIPGMS